MCVNDGMLLFMQHSMSAYMLSMNTSDLVPTEISFSAFRGNTYTPMWGMYELSMYKWGMWGVYYTQVCMMIRFCA